jgi:hypothetical protein
MATDVMHPEQEQETAVSTSAPLALASEPDPRLIRDVSGVQSDWREPLAMWAVSRVLVALALVAGSLVWPMWHDMRVANPHAETTADLPGYIRNYRAQPAEYGRSPFIGVKLGGAWSWLAPFVQWDAIWFQSVAQQGYMYFPALKTQQNIVYFPGYPGLIWLAGRIGLPGPLAAVLIAHLATMVASVLMYRLVARRYGLREARWVTLTWLFWPTSLFGSCGYSDSLFAVFCALSLGDLLEGRLVRSGVWNGLATAVRGPGLALGFTLLPWLCTRQAGWAVLGGLLSLTGLLSFFAWHYQMSGDFLLYFQVGATWRDAADKTWNPLIWALIVVRDGLKSVQIALHGKPTYLLYSSHLWEPLLAGVAGLLLIGVCRLRKTGRVQNAGLLLSSLFMLAIPLSSGSLTSLGRYSWCNLPLFLVLGVAMARAGWRWAWLAASGSLLIWLAVMHGGGWEVI